MTDRRTETAGLNIMQRVFDELSDEIGTSMEQLALWTGLEFDAIEGALRRLRLQRALAPASCMNGVWLYMLRHDAIRPVDRRGGGKRQMEQEAA